jgi:Spy/CpxP family protein refolding chaperone
MHHGEGMGPGRGFHLTPEQRTAFRDLRRKFVEENAQLIGALVGKKIELRALWSDPKADPKTIVEKEKEFSNLKYQISEKAVQFKLEARKSLSPEQISEFGSFLAMERPYRHGHRMGRMHKGDMGYGMMGHRGRMREGGMGCCDGEKMEHEAMMHHGGMMMDHREKMNRDDMMGCCGGERMGSDRGMGGRMGHRMGGMGGMGMCQ